MRRFSRFLGIVPAVALLAGCGKSPEPKEKTSPAPQGGGSGAPITPASSSATAAAAKSPDVKLVKLDLSAVGLPCTIEAPEGAKAEKIPPEPCSYEVTCGDHFTLVIAQGAHDMPDAKRFAEKNDVAKLKRFLVDEPDTLMYEADLMGRPQYIFDANIKAGDRTYYVRDGRRDYTKEDVELMLRCAKTLAPKE